MEKLRLRMVKRFVKDKATSRVGVETWAQVLGQPVVQHLASYAMHLSIELYVWASDQ